MCEGSSVFTEPESGGSPLVCRVRSVTTAGPTPQCAAHLPAVLALLGGGHAESAWEQECRELAGDRPRGTRCTGQGLEGSGAAVRGVCEAVRQGTALQGSVTLR